MSSNISVLENRGGKTVLYWPFIPSIDTAKYFKMYYSLRKDITTFTLVKPVANAIAFSHVYAQAEILRSDLSIPKEANFYVNYTMVDNANVESALDPANTKIIYQDGLFLASGTDFQDVDYQDGIAPATDVDFTTTDRFDTVLKSLLVSRSTTNPIDITVSLKGDSQEILITAVTNIVDKVWYYDFNQEVYDTETRDARVQVTGVAGGSMSVVISRKRVVLVSGAA